MALEIGAAALRRAVSAAGGFVQVRRLALILVLALVVCVSPVTAQPSLTLWTTRPTPGRLTVYWTPPPGQALAAVTRGSTLLGTITGVAGVWRQRPPVDIAQRTAIGDPVCVYVWRADGTPISQECSVVDAGYIRYYAWFPANP